MALTTYMISQASDHLSPKLKELWVFLFKKLPKYQAYAIVYSDLLMDRLDAAEGTIKARMLNALMKEIDDLEVGEVSIQGDRDGTHWSQTTERMTLIEEAFDALFDDISMLIIPTTGIIQEPDGTLRSGAVASGQRNVHKCCPVCNYYYRYLNGRYSCGCGV